MPNSKLSDADFKFYFNRWFDRIQEIVPGDKQEQLKEYKHEINLLIQKYVDFKFEDYSKEHVLDEDFKIYE